MEIQERKGSALDALTGMMDDEPQGFNPVPVVVKINHQESTFTMPGIPASPRMTGVILASRKVRVFFPNLANREDRKKLLDFTPRSTLHPLNL